MTKTDPTTTESAKDFVARLGLSGLLNDAQQSRVKKLLGPSIRQASDAARVLTTAAILTEFQARRLLAGKTDGFVLGQYVILDQLRAGHFARLYKARHRTMNRIVALNLLSSEATRNPKRRQAFQMEARQAAQFAHPNLVTILDTNEIGERLFLVQEYIEGLSIPEIMRTVHRLDVHRACEIVRQAALGLQHIHERGLIYGQFHPGCLWVCQPPTAGAIPDVIALQVKVTNFALRKQYDQEDLEHYPTDYQAPELFDLGKPATIESDLYSLGCVLYFLLTGEPPFDAQTDEHRAQAHQHEPVRSIQTMRPNIANGLDQLVQKLLSKDPKRRLLSADELAVRLEAYTDKRDGASEVDFELPLQSPTTNQISTKSGFLSGLQEAPNLSDANSQTPSPMKTITVSTDSPWANLSGTIRTKRRTTVQDEPQSNSPFVLIVIALASMLIVSAICFSIMR
ncbi:MAG: serine/threonine protein kinase [Fimbriiglobus sp.]